MGSKTVTKGVATTVFIHACPFDRHLYRILKVFLQNVMPTQLA
jgi:hypothetical protein